MSDRAAYVLAGAIVLAGLLSGGIYDMQTGPVGNFMANRFTGSFYGCFRDAGCK